MERGLAKMVLEEFPGNRQTHTHSTTLFGRPAGAGWAWLNGVDTWDRKKTAAAALLGWLVRLAFWNGNEAQFWACQGCLIGAFFFVLFYWEMGWVQLLEMPTEMASSLLLLI